MVTWGHTRAQLEALWQRTCEKPLWLPPNLLRYVRLSRRMNLTPLRRKDVHVLGPQHGVPKCRACTDICCIGKANTVSLRLSDIAMLIDLGRTDLIDLAPRALNDGTTAARKRFVSSRTFEVFPVLKQDARERCLALSADKKCTLHPNWPLSCARFPYSLDLDAREVFYSPRCPVYDVVENPADARVETMVNATLAAYNERIRDWILLEYRRPEVDALGLSAFLRPQA